MSYSLSQPPRDYRILPTYLYGELLKIKNALEELSGGALFVGSKSVSADYTLDDSDYLVVVDTTSSDITITLPTPDEGRQVSLKKLVAANTVTVSTAGSETIDGASTQSMTAQYENLVLCSHEANWHIL